MLIYNKTGKPILEEILEITYFYDYPIKGVVFFCGSLCYFENTFDETEDNYSQIYLLRPIPEEIYNAIVTINATYFEALEKWKMQSGDEILKLDPFKITEFITDKPKYYDLSLKVKIWLEGERKDEFCSIGNNGFWREFNEENGKWVKECCENPNNLTSGVFWDLFDYNNDRRASFANSNKFKPPY